MQITPGLIKPVSYSIIGMRVCLFMHKTSTQGNQGQFLYADWSKQSPATPNTFHPSDTSHLLFPGREHIELPVNI